MIKFGQKLKWGQPDVVWGQEVYAVPPTPDQAISVGWFDSEEATDPRLAPGFYQRMGTYDGEQGRSMRAIDPLYQAFYDSGYYQGSWTREFIPGVN